jgi:plastocyanin
MNRRYTLPLLISGGIAAALSPLTGARAAEHSVEIRGLAFIPEDIVISLGDTVTWVNADEDDHDLGGNIDSPVLRQGQKFAFTFEQGGEFPYTCKIHTYMQGVVRVANADGTVPPPSEQAQPDPVPSTTTTAYMYPPLGLTP